MRRWAKRVMSPTAADDDYRTRDRVAAVGQRHERPGGVAADAQLGHGGLAEHGARAAQVAVDPARGQRAHAEHRGAAQGQPPRALGAGPTGPSRQRRSIPGTWPYISWRISRTSL